MNRMILPLAFCLGLASMAADAQIYRCEDNGKVLYANSPCGDAPKRLNLGPNAVETPGASDAALRREIEQLREDIRRMEAARQAQSSPGYGRSESDLRAQQANSYECQQAMRSYEISANSIKGKDVEQKRVAMYVACGMREPDRGTTVIVR